MEMVSNGHDDESCERVLAEGTRLEILRFHQHAIDHLFEFARTFGNL